MVFKFFLQKKPDKEDLAKIYELDKSCVKLFAISPTGKTWSQQSLALEDIGNPNMRKENILKLAKEREMEIEHIKNTDEELYKSIIKEAENAYDEIIKDHANRGDSVPDGWIIIEIDGKIKNAIILENKKWDLDPYQLINHVEKSLKKDYCEDCISIIKYDTIYKFFADLAKKHKLEKNIFVRDFLEYLTVLGYEPIDNDLEILIDDENSNNDDSSAIHFSQITQQYAYKKIDYIIKGEYNNLKYKESLRQLYPEVDDNNVNIYFDVYIKSNQLIIDISSEIGARNKDYNIELFEKLKNNKDKCEPLKNAYKGCKWCKFYKIGQVAGIKYLDIKEYDEIEEYLQEMELSKVYRRLSKKELLDEFNDYKEKFKNFGDGEKGVLEYLRILSRKEYEKNDTVTFDDLEKYITEETEKHIKGLTFINELVNPQ